MTNSPSWKHATAQSYSEWHIYLLVFRAGPHPLAGGLGSLQNSHSRWLTGGLDVQCTFSHLGVTGWCILLTFRIGIKVSQVLKITEGRHDQKAIHASPRFWYRDNGLRWIGKAQEGSPREMWLLVAFHFWFATWLCGFVFPSVWPLSFFIPLDSTSIFSSLKKSEGITRGTMNTSMLDSRHWLPQLPKYAKNRRPFQSHVMDGGSWYIQCLKSSFSFSIFFLCSLSRGYNFIIKPQISLSAAGRLARQDARKPEVGECGQTHKVLWDLSPMTAFPEFLWRNGINQKSKNISFQYQFFRYFMTHHQRCQ